MTNSSTNSDGIIPARIFTAVIFMIIVQGRLIKNAEIARLQAMALMSMLSWEIFCDVFNPAASIRTL